jgi:hypothetical protein
VPIRLFACLSKQLKIINISHLPCELAYCKLAVPEQVVQGLLVLPVFRLLLQNSFQIKDFVFREHANVSFATFVLQKSDACLVLLGVLGVFKFNFFV